MHRLARSFALLLLALTLTGRAGLAIDATASGATRATVAKACGDGGQAYVRKLLRLHNRQRRSHGLQGLRMNGRLSRAARTHACEMVSHHYFGHASPNGAGPADRVAATGYGRGCSWWMDENILTWSPALSPREAMTKWLQSATHRANILGGRWRDVGIAAIPRSTRGSGLTLVVEFGWRSR